MKYNALAIMGILVSLTSIDARAMDTLEIATGPENGSYHNFLKRLNEMSLRYCESKIDYKPTGGSEENLCTLLERDFIDLALVQSDAFKYIDDELKKKSITSGEQFDQYIIYRDSFAVVRTLFQEKIHVITRRESDIASIMQLRDRWVYYGNVGSGSWITARHIFNALGITPKVDDRDIDSDRLELPTSMRPRECERGGAFAPGKNAEVNFSEQSRLTPSDAIDSLVQQKPLLHKLNGEIVVSPIEAIIIVGAKPLALLHNFDQARLAQLKLVSIGDGERRRLGYDEAAKITQDDYSWIQAEYETAAMRALLITRNSNSDQVCYNIREFTSFMEKNVSKIRDRRFQSMYDNKEAPPGWRKSQCGVPPAGFMFRENLAGGQKCGFIRQE